MSKAAFDRNLAISASAGSGKTFQLAHRYIRLLADGVAPDRICALTFSRKAAGEIFDSIVGYLSQAAEDDRNAEKTADNIGRHTQTSEFVAMLRSFLDGLHRVHIGTLDSFMVGVVKAFPGELGIPADISIGDTGGSEAMETRREILEKIFNDTSNTEAANRFMAAFKASTAGREEKTITKTVSDFIDKALEKYWLLPEESCWGAPEKIGIEKRWLTPLSDIKAVAEYLRELCTECETEKLRERFNVFAAVAEDFRVGSPWPKKTDQYLINKLLPELQNLERGSLTLNLDRKDFEFTSDIARSALILLRHIICCVLEAKLRQTAGMFSVLDHYANEYERYIRETGKLSFGDIQMLLSGSNGQARTITRDRNEEGRLYIDYRLDCQLDHWLLDEFQDTSDMQWNGLRNLADEIIQDDSAERSFFYVGDVKQAIYGWRGGNAALFQRILDHYGELIQTRDMSISFRSVPSVLNTVNRVFGGVAEADGLRDASAKKWNAIWREHKSAEHLQEITGYSALIEAETDGRGSESLARDNATAALINKIDPTRRGIEVAVLVRTNSEGARIVNHLRSSCPGVTITHEGRAFITDNPVVPLLLAALENAVHPGDIMAARHIEMSPLAGKLPGHAELFAKIHTHGFRECLRSMIDRLVAEIRMDAFTESRIEALLSAAAEFDASGRRDIDLFINFINGYSLKEQSSCGGVRVMTIHQSKGLGFDAVILPQLQSRNITSCGQLDLTVADDENGEPSWALDMPRREISEVVPPLDRQVDIIDDDHCFDSLCNLYVAMTRPKRALYMITHFVKKSTSTNEAFFIRNRLGEIADGETDLEKCTILYEDGQRDWFTSFEHSEPAADAQSGISLPTDFPQRESQRRQLERVEPSGAHETHTPAAHLFGEENSKILDFGNAIHAMFEAVEWVEDADADAIAEAWQNEAGCADDVKRDAIIQFKEAMQSPDTRRALAKPDGPAHLWREKSFELVLDGRWITGQFDRVTIHLNEKNEPVAADILDYKSNRVDQPEQFKKAVEHYRPQLETYRRSLSAILKIPEESITASLLFTRAGKLFSIRD